MDAGRRRGTGSGPTGTGRRRLTVVPTSRVPAAGAGPAIGSAPSVVSPVLRSGVVRFPGPSGWAETESGVDRVSRIRSLEEQRSLSGVVPRMLENREFGDLADGMGDRLK